MDDMVHDSTFVLALYHVLMHVHIVDGVMECPVTQKQFTIQNEIPNMILPEEECERVRY
jgi:uncharacterized protein YbaR (Trm112 family)